MSAPWHALTWLLLVGAGLAGCSDPPAAADEAGTGDPATSPGDGIGLPAWAVGDAWTYRFNGEDATYVVADDAGGDWLMGTDSPERAFSDARDDISRLGPQRKTDLAGSQGGDRVEFFRWPLRDGATWATRWDGQDVTIEAQASPQPGVFAFTARNSTGAIVYAYTYDEEARWFRSLTHYGPAGDVLVQLDLVEAARNWTGTLVHWTLVEVVRDAGMGDTPPAVAGPVDVPAGTTDVWMDYHFTCTGSGGFSVAFQPANPGLAAQQGVVDSGPCVQVDWTGPAVEGPQPGTWMLLVTAGGQTVRYDYTVLLRTRLDVEFGVAQDGPATAKP